MQNPPFITPQGVTINTESSLTEAPPVPMSVIAALGANKEILQRLHVSEISRRTNTHGQEFYVSVGSDVERQAEVREAIKPVAAMCHASIVTGRSLSRNNYVSFTIPSAA